MVVAKAMSSRSGTERQMTVIVPSRTCCCNSTTLNSVLCGALCHLPACFVYVLCVCTYGKHNCMQCCTCDMNVPINIEMESFFLVWTTTISGAAFITVSPLYSLPLTLVLLPLFTCNFNAVVVIPHPGTCTAYICCRVPLLQCAM